MIKVRPGIFDLSANIHARGARPESAQTSCRSSIGKVSGRECTINPFKLSVVRAGTDSLGTVLLIFNIAQGLVPGSHGYLSRIMQPQLGREHLAGSIPTRINRLRYGHERNDTICAILIDLLAHVTPCNVFGEGPDSGSILFRRTIAAVAIKKLARMHFHVPVGSPPRNARDNSIKVFVIL